ncbi:MAG: type II and III secretion system protein, partial [Coleofasciculaceae cyanobacterium SM2_3_26]|nr:type II and III secretion system protein [Coleofasciculaceae cyanobacterium SM2_3_26]
MRRRQVAVNVRVIDVSLAGVDRFTTSFSFGVDDTRVIQTGGVGLINFGTSTPATTTPQLDPINTFNDIVSSNSPEEFTFARRFLAQLQAVITSGNAKILTDPNLVVQEGQTATVQLTEDVITNFQVVTSGAGENFTQTIQLERTPAGLILQIQVDRIDDNGFITMQVNPRVAAPTQTFDTGDGEITLLAVRELSSGRIRVRDGQTLILSGIIQESDRTIVSKIPILGDIPILGALFRSTQRENVRQEVIIVLTPQVLDDSDLSNFGYSYVPSQNIQEVLQPQGVQVP